MIQRHSVWFKWEIKMYNWPSEFKITKLDVQKAFSCFFNIQNWSNPSNVTVWTNQWTPEKEHNKKAHISEWNFKMATSTSMLLPSATWSNFCWSIDTTCRSWMFTLFFSQTAKHSSNEIRPGSCKSYDMRLVLLPSETI